MPPSEARSGDGDRDSDLVRRKRELDRVAQRNSRERTKHRIKFLEEKVRNLESGDRDEKLDGLLMGYEEVLKDNAHLKTAISKIRRIADSIVKGQESTICANCRKKAQDPQDFDPPKRQDDSHQPTESLPDIHTTNQQELLQVSTELPALAREEMLPIPDLETSVYAPDLPEEFCNQPVPLEQLVQNSGPLECQINPLCQYSNNNCISTAEIPEMPVMAWTSLAADWYIPSTPQDSQSTESIIPHELKWEFSDRVFRTGLELTRKTQKSAQVKLDPSVPIRAILWGWDTIDQETSNNPAWLALKAMNDRVFGTWRSNPQRIALMYICSLVMMYRVEPTPENLERLPSWMRPRPSQEYLQHPLVIDFLIWPGLREVLVFNYRMYTQNGDFSQRFVEDFDFYWPFPEAMMYYHDANLSVIGLSSLFKEYVHNLNNWTMKPRFFERYKELGCEIPCTPQADSSLGNFIAV